jgi:hypothetical protein
MRLKARQQIGPDQTVGQLISGLIREMSRHGPNFVLGQEAALFEMFQESVPFHGVSFDRIRVR